MPGYLRQSTASQSRALGPFLDDTDFKTAETALTIANTDIKLIVNGGASANKNSGGGTHRANGVYGVTFDATDTATVGEIEVSVVVSGALPVFDKFTVLEEAVYDALFASSAPGYVANAPVNVAQFGGSDGTFSGGRPEVNTSHIAGSAVSTSSAQIGVNVVNFGGSAGTFASGIPSVNAAQISGDSVAADNAESFFDGTGYAGTNNVIPTVTTLTGHTPQTGDNYARLGAPAGASVSADIAAVKTDTGNLVSRITATLFSGITSLAQWLGLIAGKQTGDTTARTELRATGAGSGTFDETTDSLQAIKDLGDANWPTATGFAQPGDQMDLVDSPNATAISALTVAMEAAMLNEGDATALLAAIAAKVEEFLINEGDATATLAAIATAVNSAVVAGTVGTNLAAVKAKTDNLPADPAGLADLATAHGAGSWATATGFSTLDAAGVRSAVGLASADLDTQLDALPTAAENATAILAAGDVDGYTLEEAQKLMLAALTGILAGAATTTITIRAADNSKVRITATVDADGNRSALTLDAAG